MTGKNVEVAPQRTNVDRRVRYRLGAVDQDHSTLRVSGVDDSLDRKNGSQRVRYVSDGHELGARRQQLEELVEFDFAAQIDGRHLQRAARLFAHHLPGHDVGVMLQARNQNLVARLEARTSVGLGDQIDALGRAPDKDDLASRAGVYETSHTVARAFERFRRRLAQCMNAAMNVGVGMGFIFLDRAQHRNRSLR